MANENGSLQTHKHEIILFFSLLLVITVAERQSPKVSWETFSEVDRSLKTRYVAIVLRFAGGNARSRIR